MTARMSRKSGKFSSDFSPVKKIIHGVIKSLENPGKLREAALFQLWKERVPLEIQKRAMPERLYGKKLYVGVGEAVWVHELNLKYRKEILEMFRREVGEENLEDIYFHIGRRE